MSNDSRVPSGVPTGGQFASTSRSEASVGLPSDAPGHFTVPLFGRVDFDPQDFDELPEYPATLPEAEVTINWDGGMQAFITVGGEAFTWWTNDNSENFNDLDRKDPEWDADTKEQFVEWADAVFDRMDVLVYQTATRAVSGDVEKAIVDSAVGRKFEPLNPVFTEAELEFDAPKRAVSRVARGAEQWFNPGTREDVDDYVVQGLLSDLRHYADTLGIDWHQLVDNAERMYEDEVANPEG